MNKISNLLTVFILLVVCAGCSSTQEQPSSDFSQSRPSISKSSKNVKQKPVLLQRSVSRQDVIEYLMANNPELKSLRAKVKAADSAITQVRLWPNPELKIGADHMPTDEIKLNEARKTVSLMQKVEMGGKRSARVKVARKKKDLAESVCQARERELILQVKKVFNALLLAREELKLAKESLEIENKLSDMTETARSSGRIAQEELLQSRIRLARAKLSLHTKEEAYQNVVHALRELLALNEFTPLESKDKLEPLFCEASSEEFKASMLQHHPQVKIARVSVKVTDVRLIQDLAQRIPDIKFGLGYMESEMTGDDMVGVTVEIPLPVFDRNQGKIAQTRHERISAREKLASVENNLCTVLAQVINNYQLAKDKVLTYQNEILPSEEKNYEIAQELHKSGRASYQKLLSARLKLIDTTLTYLRFAKLLNDTTAELEYLSGKTK